MDGPLLVLGARVWCPCTSCEVPLVKPRPGQSSLSILPPHAEPPCLRMMCTWCKIAWNRNFLNLFRNGRSIAQLEHFAALDDLVERCGINSGLLPHKLDTVGSVWCNGELRGSSLYLARSRGYSSSTYMREWYSCTSSPLTHRLRISSKSSSISQVIQREHVTCAYLYFPAGAIPFVRIGRSGGEGARRENPPRPPRLH
jgi:hypothetical protein